VGIPMDYGSYASTYATARWAMPWIVRSLREAVERAPPGSAILEIGCGTGNYVEALRGAIPGRRCVGLDRSPEMIAQAVRLERGGYALADADRALPLRSRVFALAFVVDVLHHLTDYATFFSEVARVLGRAGAFVAVTDSDENLRKRSLTRFFPEVLDVELRRYPTLDQLDRAASTAGLRRVRTELAEGLVELDDAFIAKLEAKCSSGMRLIPDACHRRGMERVREARARGERWLSSYSVLTYARDAA
jgi:SAM-dependent methyltransferase